MYNSSRSASITDECEVEYVDMDQNQILYYGSHKINRNIMAIGDIASDKHAIISRFQGKKVTSNRQSRQLDTVGLDYIECMFELPPEVTTQDSK